MEVFDAAQNEFLVFEDGPSVEVFLQWATYRDASDQCSLSRIWGGIHPPADDVPGRLIGEKVGVDAFHYAETYFFYDGDGDGYFDFEDCDDNNELINPDAEEIPNNGIDEDCDGMDLTIGTKENNLNDLINVFPNQVKNVLTINYDYSGKMNLQIFNNEGKLLFEKTITFLGNTANTFFNGACRMFFNGKSIMPIKGGKAFTTCLI